MRLTRLCFDEMSGGELGATVDGVDREPDRTPRELPLAEPSLLLLVLRFATAYTSAPIGANPNSSRANREISESLIRSARSLVSAALLR